jgi:hypothetical protein
MIEPIIQEIIEAKGKAGELAILNLAINDLCHLWGSQPASNDEVKLMGSWKLNKSEREQLIGMSLGYLSIQA